jgi:ferredoxin
MIISELKPFEQVIDSLKEYRKIFLVGCGECATLCKSGGEEQLLDIKKKLQEAGKTVVGMCVPESTCTAAKLKTEIAKNMKEIRQAEAVLVLACGLGVQSVKDNDRLGLTVLPGCNTSFAAVMDSQGNFSEKCSMCGNCVLDITSGICPITLCPKGLLNGPCGGMNKGKCELDQNRDCAWVLIFKEAQKGKKLERFKKINPPKDFNKATKPHSLVVNR